MCVYICVCMCIGVCICMHVCIYICETGRKEQLKHKRTTKISSLPQTHQHRGMPQLQ